MLGNCIPREVAAGRLTKDVTTANVSSSLSRDVFKVFSKGCSPGEYLKDYRWTVSAVNLKHDPDIQGIPKDSPRTRRLSTLKTRHPREEAFYRRDDG